MRRCRKRRQGDDRLAGQLIETTAHKYNTNTSLHSPQIQYKKQYKYKPTLPTNTIQKKQYKYKPTLPTNTTQKQYKYKPTLPTNTIQKTIQIQQIQFKCPAEIQGPLHNTNTLPANTLQIQTRKAQIQYEYTVYKCYTVK